MATTKRHWLWNAFGAYAMWSCWGFFVGSGCWLVGVYFGLCWFILFGCLGLVCLVVFCWLYKYCQILVVLIPLKATFENIVSTLVCKRCWTFKGWILGRVDDEYVTERTRKENGGAKSKIGARNPSKGHVSWNKAKHECRWYEMVLQSHTWCQK